MSELDIACLKLRLAIDKGFAYGKIATAAEPKKGEAKMYVALKSADIRKQKRERDLVSRARGNYGRDN